MGESSSAEKDETGSGKIRLVSQWRLEKKSEHAVVACNDGDFVQKARHAIREHLQVKGDSFLSTLLGGAYGLCRPKTLDPARWIMWWVSLAKTRKEISIAIHKKGIRDIAVSSHEDCLQIALDGNIFLLAADEFDFHLQVHREARARILGWFPELPIRVTSLFVHVMDVNGELRVGAHDITCQ